MATRFACSLAALLFSLVMSTTARADGYYSIVIKDFPADGAVGVPLNPVLLFNNMNRVFSTDIELLDPSGTLVPLTRDWDERSYAPCNMRRPVADLAPETTYTVRIRSLVDSQQWTTSFTTGSARDVQEPTVRTNGMAECKNTTYTLPFDGSDDVVVAYFDASSYGGQFCITPDDAVTFTANDGIHLRMESDVVFVDQGGNMVSAPVTITDDNNDCYDWWEGYDDCGQDDRESAPWGCSSAHKGSSGADVLLLVMAFILLAPRCRK